MCWPTCAPSVWSSVQKLGKAESEYRKITFHKETLEQDQHIDAVLVGPGHPLYAAVDEKLNAALNHAAGATALFIDAQATAPYRLHFFEISIRGQGQPRRRRAAIRRSCRRPRGSRFAGSIEVVPADVLIDLAPHPQPWLKIDPADAQPAADHLKSTYQLEVRQRCQQERQQFSAVVRDYLERSFKARINKAQDTLHEPDGPG